MNGAKKLILGSNLSAREGSYYIVYTAVNHYTNFYNTLSFKKYSAIKIVFPFGRCI